MTNALFTARMCAYKQSPEAIETALLLVKLKISRRTVLLKRYQVDRHEPSHRSIQNIRDVLLFEARAAKQFWSSYCRLVPAWALFSGRKPRAHDICNHVLDIGYHHVMNVTKQIFQQKDISTALGLLHSPRNVDSMPLVYDLVELWRADLVERSALTFLRQKKKPMSDLDQKHIAQYLRMIDQGMDRLYYLKDFGQCHRYRYYMDLQITKFIKAVNHTEVFAPLHLPTRHDTRCT